MMIARKQWTKTRQKPILETAPGLVSRTLDGMIHALPTLVSLAPSALFLWLHSWARQFIAFSLPL